MERKLPTKAEKAMAIAGVIVRTHQGIAKTFETFGNNMASVGISTAQAAAALTQLANIKAVRVQPEEHPLSKAVKEATKTLNQEEIDEKEG